MGIVTLPSFGSDPAIVTAAALDGKVDPLATEFNGNIENANVKSSAAIAYSKLNLATSILNADVSASAAIAASKLDLSPVEQTVQMSGAAVDFAKGSDIASATTTDIGAATGNVIDVTGTTTITGLGSVQAGVIRFVQFDGALTLTHNASSLILPGGANITTAAGDYAVFQSEGSGNWRCVAYTKASGVPVVATTAATALSGSVVQTSSTNITTPVDVTAVYVLDDTAPLYQEGTAIANSGAFTPNNSSNTLVIKAWFHGNFSAAQSAVAYICDATGTDEALAITLENGAAAAGGSATFSVQFSVTAGSTSARTYYLLGGVSSGTLYAGRGVTGADLFGAAIFGNITIQEIKA